MSEQLKTKLKNIAVAKAAQKALRREQAILFYITGAAKTEKQQLKE